jgi:hypothetical protein
MGMNIASINWILGRIQSSSFTVLFNDSPFKFFIALMGILQGWTISPFLFLLVAEGLNKLINNTIIHGNLKGL